MVLYCERLPETAYMSECWCDAPIMSSAAVLFTQTHPMSSLPPPPGLSFY